MRKLFTVIIAAAAMSLTLGSCLNDDNGADAEMGYIGLCDSIVYNDSVADLKLDSFIKVGLKSMKVTGTPFTEKAHVEESSYINAVIKCNQQAVERWKSMVSTLTLKEIEKAMFKECGDTLVKMGYKYEEGLSLSPITVKTKLYNAKAQTVQDYVLKYDVYLAN